MFEQETRMKRHEINALFRLLPDHVQHQRRIHVRDVSFKPGYRFVDGNRSERSG